MNLKSNWLGQTKHLVLITKKTQCETNGSKDLDIIIRLVCLSNNLIHFTSTLLSHIADILSLYYRKEKHGYKYLQDFYNTRNLSLTCIYQRTSLSLDYITCKAYIYTSIHVYTFTHIPIL